MVTMGSLYGGDNLMLATQYRKVSLTVLGQAFVTHVLTLVSAFFFCGQSAVLRPSVHMLPGIWWCSAGLPPFPTACWWLTHPATITGVSVSARWDSPGGCGVCIQTYIHRGQLGKDMHSHVFTYRHTPACMLTYACAHTHDCCPPYPTLPPPHSYAHMLAHSHPAFTCIHPDTCAQVHKTHLPLEK